MLARGTEILANAVATHDIVALWRAGPDAVTSAAIRCVRALAGGSQGVTVLP